MEEPYHLVLIHFAQIQEQDHLEHARRLDLQYHLGKLIALANSDKASLIWDEHDKFRAALTDAPAPPPPSDDLMRRAAALWKRCRAAEARHGAH